MTIKAARRSNVKQYSLLCHILVGNAARQLSQLWLKLWRAQQNDRECGEYYVDEDYPDLKCNNLFLNEAVNVAWLRIIHSGNWCLHLTVCTPNGACQKWMNEYIACSFELNSNNNAFFHIIDVYCCYLVYEYMAFTLYSQWINTENNTQQQNKLPTSSSHSDVRGLHP